MLGPMDIATVQPVQGLQHLQQILQNTLPHYRVETNVAGVVVSNGLCTGLQLKQASPQLVRSGWIIPNVAVRLLWSLGMVLTGILPGLLVYGIIYLVVKDGVANIERDVATILRGGAVAAPMGAMSQASQQPARPSAPGAGLLVGAIAAAVIGLASIGFGYEDFERVSSMRAFAARMRSSAGSSYGYGSYRSESSFPSYFEQRAQDRALSGGLKVTFGLLCVVGAGAAIAFRSVKRKQFFAHNPALAMG